MKLLVINGVTGAIGNGLLARFAQEKDWVVYGLSRRGCLLERQLQKNQKLPTGHLITTLGPDITDEASCARFVNAVDVSAFSEIVYVHTVGSYAFEVEADGTTRVMEDCDGDGIDDRVMALTYTAVRNMVESLLNLQISFKAVLFGSLADRYQPTVHHSWWKTIGKTKRYLQEEIATGKLGVLVQNLSSVICAHELTMRPYVFTATDAQASLWLTPQQIADEVYREVASLLLGELRERDLFRAMPGFNPETYYEDSSFTPRKVAELYGKALT